MTVGQKAKGKHPQIDEMSTLKGSRPVSALIIPVRDQTSVSQLLATYAHK